MIKYFFSFVFFIWIDNYKFFNKRFMESYYKYSKIFDFCI